MRTLCIFTALVCFGLAQGYRLSHSASSSTYVHSNDTIVLTLAERQTNVLHGAPNTLHSLEFTLINQGTQGHFSIEQNSEDGFTGILSKTDTYLSEGQQQTITVSNMRVPQRPDGARVRFTLTVERDSGMKKREAPPGQPGGRPVGGGSVGGGVQYPGSGDPQYPPNQQYPNQQYPGNGGSYNPGYNNNNGGGNYNPGYNPYDDPSNRRELSITVEFTVTQEMDDNKKPWTKLSYGAEDESDTCNYEPTDPGCNNGFWWIKFRVQDEESGLNTIQFAKTGKDTSSVPIYYRYLNFALGTDQEQLIIAAASCCTEGIVLRVTDAAGNQEEHYAKNGGTGTPMSPGLKWGLIGGGIAIVILIVVIVVVCCCKKRYSAVPSE